MLRVDPLFELKAKMPLLIVKFFYKATLVQFFYQTAIDECSWISRASARIVPAKEIEHSGDPFQRRIRRIFEITRVVKGVRPLQILGL